MKYGWLARIAGLTAGVALVAGAAALLRPAKPLLVPSGAVISECDGEIGQVAIQYTGGMDFVWPTYRAFLAALPASVKVELLCPGPADRDELLAHIGQPASRFTIVFTSHAMTTWSRDRWVTLAPAGPSEPGVLVAPRSESAAGVWPARAGDERLAGDLAAADAGLVSRRSRLAFDGGDFLADGDTVFVSPAVLERNLHQGVESEQELLKMLQPMLGKKIVMLRNAPPHHIGMYMVIAGDRVAVVGDPSLGRKLLASELTPDREILPRAGRVGETRLASEAAKRDGIVATIESDDSPATQKQFDDIAAQMKAAGYRVVRIPTVVAPDGKTYLTFVNGLIDQRNGQRTFYLPTYCGQAALNQSATRVWQSLGYAVVPIDCTDVFPHFGTLHCLVNVLKRS